MRTPGRAEKPTAGDNAEDADRRALAHLRQTLERITYGAITLTIRDHHVAQIEVSEKTRP